MHENLYSRILHESREALAPFGGNGGKAEIPIEGHLVVARTR